jgi:hypothetical protein
MKGNPIVLTGEELREILIGSSAGNEPSLW